MTISRRFKNSRTSTRLWLSRATLRRLVLSVGLGAHREGAPTHPVDDRDAAAEATEAADLGTVVAEISAEEVAEAGAAATDAEAARVVATDLATKTSFPKRLSTSSTHGNAL